MLYKFIKIQPLFTLFVEVAAAAAAYFNNNNNNNDNKAP